MQFLSFEAYTIDPSKMNLLQLAICFSVPRRSGHIPILFMELILITIYVFITYENILSYASIWLRRIEF